MSNAGLDKLIWVLIYGGLLAVCLGLFIERQDVDLGLQAVVGGAFVSSIGALLVWVRSRRR